VRSAKMAAELIGTHGLLMLASSTDGNQYKVILKTRSGGMADASIWHADFFPSKDIGGTWRIARLPYENFTAISKGHLALARGCTVACWWRRPQASVASIPPNDIDNSTDQVLRASDRIDRELRVFHTPLHVSDSPTHLNGHSRSTCARTSPFRCAP